jgi:integrase
MTLVFRYTALRISDVAVMKRAHVSDDQVFVRAEKNGKPVRLPIPVDLVQALAAVPHPRAASETCPYFFWSGRGSKESAIRDVRRTMVAVFRKAGVPNAHPHKFRHTLAVEILVGGGTIEDVASILGDSPSTVRKHYAPWTTSRQERISSLMSALHSGTNLAHTGSDGQK